MLWLKKNTKILKILLNVGFVKKHEGGKVKVKDDNHITVKYWGSARQECSLNLSLLEVKVTFEVFNFIDIFKK